MKFKVVEAGSLPKDTTVIARVDEYSMHGNSYLVVNAEKPYATTVAALIKAIHPEALLQVEVPDLRFMDVSIFERKAYCIEPEKITATDYIHRSYLGLFYAETHQLVSGRHKLDLNISMDFANLEEAHKWASVVYTLFAGIDLMKQQGESEGAV